MSFVERFIVLCPYLGESTIGGSTAVACGTCPIYIYMAAVVAIFISAFFVLFLSTKMRYHLPTGIIM